MNKDFTKVLKANKDAPQKHRELIAEWREKGHLTELTLLYETEKVNRANDAAFIYALGYAYALTDTKQNADAEEKAIDYYETSLQHDPSLFWAHYSLGAIYPKTGKIRPSTHQIPNMSYFKSRILSCALLHR